MPFPERAIQVDGGSEFGATFEAECQRRDIKLFVLPPRLPKLNASDLPLKKESSYTVSLEGQERGDKCPVSRRGALGAYPGLRRFHLFKIVPF